MEELLSSETKVCCLPGAVTCCLKGKIVLDEAQLWGIYRQASVMGISLSKFYLIFLFWGSVIIARNRMSAYGHVAPYSYPGEGRFEFRAEILQVSQLFLANYGIIWLNIDRFLSNYFQLILSVINIPSTLHILELVTMSHNKALQSTERNQNKYRLIYYSKSALQVSGDVFAHHQEHLTVFTVSGSVHPSSCRLLSHQPAATWVNTTRYCKYSQMLLMLSENIARNM